ncbi:MAG TPA: Ig-like domain-containing protein, partial [Longimicrobiales bacterium]|nr:Ig-like domain-containing protein [Longimicrobiales bacterium]
MSVIAGVLAVAAACGDSGEDPIVTSISVTPASGEIGVLGATLQFTAVVRDQDGDVMSGQSVVWTSDDPTVASIDALSGLATALDEGDVTITAAVGTVSGTADLAVTSAPCTEELAMDPGDIRVLAVNCDVFIPSGSDGDRYRVAILNKDTNGSEDALAARVSTATLNVTALGVVTAPAFAPAARATTESTALADPIGMSITARKYLRWGHMLQEQTRRAHLRLRESEAVLVQALGTEALLPSAARAETGAFPQAADLPARIVLRNNDGTSCEDPEARTPAFLLAQDANLAVYQDSALNVAAGTKVTPAEAQMILDYYTDYGKGVIDDYFHGVPDVDSNGKVIVYISFDDNLEDGATAAYVWGGDLFEAAGCAASNEAELMYFNAALAREVDDGFAQALETSVHEVKHVSSFWQGIRRNDVLAPISNPFQPSWIEEGTAEIAANVATRVSWNAIGGPAVNAMVTEDDIRNTAFDSNNDIYPEALGIVIRLSRVQGYLSSQPNGVVATPNGAEDGHSVYGSGWTFFRWLGDAYGQAGIAPLADADFFTSQNDSTTQPGLAGLAAITGVGFGQLLEEFAAAQMLHRTGVPEGPRAFTSYDFISSIEMFCFAADNPPCDGSSAGPPGTFPWP